MLPRLFILRPSMEVLTLRPVRRISGTVRLPGSKSISNRALLLAALAAGSTRITNLLESDDTRYMLDALAALGVELRRGTHEAFVTGKSGPLCLDDDVDAELYLGMAGTAYRPLTAALCLGRGRFRLTGNARMHERPIADLVAALRALGADITYLGAEGYPPLEIRGTGLEGGTVSMSGAISSQFLTSLLLAAPLARGPITVLVHDEQVSKPYIDITLELMRRFGVDATHADYRRFEVPRGCYRSPGEFLVEGDASAASYFLAAAAIAGEACVEGIGADSIQGDVAFVDVLRAMGVDVQVARDHVRVRRPALNRLRAIDLDLNAIPDVAMTAAVLALFADGRSRIRNIGNWRVKETDRLAAMACELRKVGARVVEGRDFIEVDPPERLVDAEIETYGDHRMAMSFALVALGGATVRIRDPECVAKTFPDYFEALAALCHRD
jgi:3-phosphoshikimate 1-carboxyvinyltransferase